ncbi:MAG: DUF5596 domain-containing protein [Clostridia bacterium]|nr:DUF5596 domain-containing protein [Clostridia bacterium]
MKLIKDLFINNCGDKVFDESFRSIYEQACAELKASGVFFLKEEYIRAVNEESAAYPRILGLLIEEADRIKRNTELSLYALFIHKAMLNRELYKKNIKHFSLPDGYELFAFLCLIPTILSTHRTLTEMGIDEDIVLATVKQYEDCVFLYSQRFDRLGMNKRYFDWLQHYVDCEILNINRLRFEIEYLKEPIRVLRNRYTGKDILVIEDGEFNSDGLYSDTPPLKDAAFYAGFNETDTEYVASPVNEEGKALPSSVRYKKTEYETIIKKGDALLSVHIPAEGDFNGDTCKESYLRARDIFKHFFPEISVKGFTCYSWMMSPELKLHMNPASRILGFASHYLRFPIHTEGEDVLYFVFYLKFKSYEDLAEDTSLQRSLKKLYLSGEKLYEYGGIFAIDRIN